MAIVVVDNRATGGLIDRADSTTGWSSPVGGEGISLVTATPDPKELTGHLAISVSEEEGEILHTHASTNLSTGVLVYVWALVQGAVDSQAAYGMSMVLGDGTNTNAYQVAGNDVAVFRHSSGQPNYQCMLLDTGALPTGKALQGTFASFDDTAVTEFGANYNVSSKALGGAVNCFTDQILYGNGGLTITGTEATDILTELSAKDAGNVSDEAYGICRDLGGGVYGIQGQLLFGDTGTGSDTLSIQDQTLKFENFSGFGTDKMGLTWQGNSTGTQTFVVDNSTLFCPSGTGSFITATNINVESLDVTNSSVLNFDQGITLTTDATNGPNWDWSNNKFVGCSQINSGKTAFKNNIIDSTIDANGGWIIDSNTSLTNVSALSFISDTTGHAIYITATGTYTFVNFSYTGYGATTTTDAVIYNNSGGAVTINVSGGDTPTYRNGASATTSIVSSKTMSIQNGTNDGLEHLGVFYTGVVDSLSANKSQFTSHATVNNISDTTFEITVTIPADTPASGTLKIFLKDSTGFIIREDVHTYTSFTGAIFSGVSPALTAEYDSNSTALVPYIEKIITTDPETYAYNFVSNREIVTVWRKVGFKQFKIAGTMTDTGYTAGIVKTKDPTVNLP